MSRYDEFSDDYYVNLNLNTEMDLPAGRETVLHFFEQVQRHYPGMRNFYSRDRGEYVLEEDKSQGQYRWTTIDPRRLCSGHVNPTDVESAFEQHRMVLELVPYSLSISPLDCESLNLMFGFDFTYRGNHNQLVAEALGMPPAFEKLAEMQTGGVVSYEPAMQISLDEDCRVQARVSVENRTTAYHMRTGEFPEEQLSVYVAARRYGSLDAGETFVDALARLEQVCIDTIENYAIEHVLRPLQQTIAMK